MDTYDRTAHDLAPPEGQLWTVEGSRFRVQSYTAFKFVPHGTILFV